MSKSKQLVDRVLDGVEDYGPAADILMPGAGTSASLVARILSRNNDKEQRQQLDDVVEFQIARLEKNFGKSRGELVEKLPITNSTNGTRTQTVTRFARI